MTSEMPIKFSSSSSGISFLLPFCLFFPFPHLVASEENILKERIDLIVKTGANVVLTSKGIDDVAVKYLVDAHAMGIRRVEKEDLRNIAKATGGTYLTYRCGSVAH